MKMTEKNTTLANNANNGHGSADYLNFRLVC